MFYKANSLVAFIIFCQLKTAILEYEFDFDLVPLTDFVSISATSSGDKTCPTSQKWTVMEES